MDITEAVQAELDSAPSLAQRAVRAGELIELLNRTLVVSLADERAMAVMHLRKEMSDDDIVTATGVSKQQIRKLHERGMSATKRRQVAP